MTWNKGHIWEDKDIAHSAHPPAILNLLKNIKCSLQSSDKLDSICLYLKTLQKMYLNVWGEKINFMFYAQINLPNYTANRGISVV